MFNSLADGDPGPDHGTYLDRLATLYENRGYEVLPELPDEEGARYVIENASSFPAVLVPKVYMKAQVDDHTPLMFGEVVLLWWLTSRKNIFPYPLYYQRKYGLNAEVSRRRLIERGYLSEDNSLTDAGRTIIDSHQDIVRKHKSVMLVGRDGPIEYIYRD